MALLALLALAISADAHFAATQGFSGRSGTDCGACHAGAPMDPTEPAQVHLDGLPTAWDVEARYELTVRVTGGPPANPSPTQPQAGFDLETDAGLFEAGAGMEGLLRFPNETEATYTGAGTLRRDWAIVWVAPDASMPPTTARFWLAGLASNGNHVMDGPDAFGEYGDRHARIELQVPPSQSAIDGWSSRAVPSPVIDEAPAEVSLDAAPALVRGHVDGFVHHVEWRIDAAGWQSASGAPAFFLYLPPLDAGPHVLELRSALDDRYSPSTNHSFTAQGAGVPNAVPAGESTSPWAPLVALGILSLLLLPLVIRIRK